MEFANPVIGTKEPAPANFPILLKTLSDVIKLFNPSIFTDEDYDKQFLKAVEFAKTIFQETLYNVEGKIKSKRVINKLINENDDKFYLELDRYMPYEDAIT